MSLLVAEFSQVLHRIVCVAPSAEELHKLFVNFGDELSTGLGVGQDLNLCVQKLPQHSGQLHYWMSFTLGKRGQLEDRISLLGVVLDDTLPSPGFWGIADAFLFWAPGNVEVSDVYFRLPFGSFPTSKPCLVGGLWSEGQESDKPNLREMALVECFRRNFKKLRFEGNPPTFLRSSLEWVLSF